MRRNDTTNAMGTGSAVRTCRRDGLALGPLLAATLATFVNGCAQPIERLWPPPPGMATHQIVVSVDSWHSVIGVWPRSGPGSQEPGAIQEWSYAERGYYLEGDMGSSSTIRAIFWPSAGVVAVRDGGPPWSERTPQPPARQWRFTNTSLALSR